MSENLPTVSIGMPVYNGAAYICEALDCLLAQTFTNFELIISDNASTDTTQTICEEYVRRDLRIRYVRQSVNQGALANFQFVLDQAQGKFFMWAAADDRWDANWIESIHVRIRDEDQIAGFGELIHIDDHAVTLDHSANAAKLQFGGKWLWRKLSFYLAYEGLGKANLFYALYPRKALQQINLRSYQFDYQILFALLDHVAYVQVKGASLYKRIHGGCEGVGGVSIWRSPIVYAPIRILIRDFQIAMHYLHVARPVMKVILALLIPLKLLVAQKFYVRRAWSLLRYKLQTQ
jgi:glycosyltransferase involved in cell wall biosynthesis